MRKHLNIFLITIVSIFSFLFISKVCAASSDFYDMSKWIDIDEFTLPNGINPDDYNIVIWERGNNGNSGSYRMVYSLKSDNYLAWINNNPSSFPSSRFPVCGGLSFAKSRTYSFDNIYFYDETILGSKVFNKKQSSGGSFNSGSYIVYSNYDIYYTNTSQKFFDTSKVNYDSNHTVNFHINGGTVIDLSNPLVPNFIELDYQIETTSEELEQYLEDITIFKDNNTFGGWYYDANFTQPYDFLNNLSSDIDLYAKWIPNPEITFHLNEGYIRIYDSESSNNNSGTSGGGSSSGGGRHEDQLITEDFSIKLPIDKINDYIESLIVEKSFMIFEGWYYDKNFNNPYHIGDNITVDTHLYAKYRYERVEDFLANTTLNEYFFDQDYNYAIINRGNHSGDVYVGLPFENFGLEVYEYNESEYKVKDGSSACPIPLYSYNKYYYYNVNTLFTNNQEVLILPRALFDTLDPNNFENPNDVYKFYLSDNAYISYTNDLSQAQIVDSNGDNISINLQNSYELSQQYQELYSNPDNIFSQVNIFINKMKKATSAIKEIFEYLFNSLNSTIKSFVIFIIVLILTTTIIRFSRRG